MSTVKALNRLALASAGLGVTGWALSEALYNGTWACQLEA
jgi:hypothetical protein